MSSKYTRRREKCSSKLDRDIKDYARYLKRTTAPFDFSSISIILSNNSIVWKANSTKLINVGRFYLVYYGLYIPSAINKEYEFN